MKGGGHALSLPYYTLHLAHMGSCFEVHKSVLSAL